MTIRSVNQYTINVGGTVLVNYTQCLFNIITRHGEIIFKHNSARVQVHSQLPYYLFVCTVNPRRRISIGKCTLVPKVASI